MEGQMEEKEDCRDTANRGDIFEIALITLLCSYNFGKESTESKWASVEIDEFRTRLSTAESINSHSQWRNYRFFSKFKTLRTTCCLDWKQNRDYRASEVYGDGSVLPSQVKNVKSLKSMVEGHIRGWTIDAVNVAYALKNFKLLFDEWDRNNPFSGR